MLRDHMVLFKTAKKSYARSSTALVCEILTGTLKCRVQGPLGFEVLCFASLIF